MSIDKKLAATEFDLDEDLFDFGEVSAGSWEDDHEPDLDELFSAFEKKEAAEAAAREEVRASEGVALAREPEGIPTPAGAPAERPAVPRAERAPAAAPRPAEVPPTAASVPAPPEASPAAPRSDAATGPPTGEPGPVQAGIPPGAPPAPAHAWAPPYYYAPPAQGWTPPRPAERGSAARATTAAVWILIAVTSMNALVALVALRSSGDMRADLRDAVERIPAVERPAPAGETAPAGNGSADGHALAAPSPDAHPTFETAREEIQRGEYRKARQRLYALLAIVDRLDPLVREDIEARANFLLAEALHLETVDQWERRR